MLLALLLGQDMGLSKLSEEGEGTTSIRIACAGVGAARPV